MPRDGDFIRYAFFVAAVSWTAGLCRRLVHLAIERATHHATAQLASGGW